VILLKRSVDSDCLKKKTVLLTALAEAKNEGKFLPGSCFEMMAESAKNNFATNQKAFVDCSCD
jgi:hypothetical protein